MSLHDALSCLTAAREHYRALLTSGDRLELGRAEVAVRMWERLVLAKQRSAGTV